MSYQDGIDALISRRDRIISEIGSYQSQIDDPDAVIIKRLKEVNNALMFLSPEFQQGASGNPVSPGSTARLKWYTLPGEGTDTVTIPAGATMQGVEVSAGSVSFTGGGNGRLIAPVTVSFEVDFYGQSFDETTFVGETPDTLFNVFYKARVI